MMVNQTKTHRVDAGQLLVEQPGQRQLPLPSVARLYSLLDFLLNPSHGEQTQR